jgi:H+/Cl- antiporter ClcA
MIRLSVQPFAAVKWLAVLIPMAAVIGSASAFFLWSLDALTRVRFANPGLLWLLPVGGFVVGWIYHYYGKAADGGSNLLIDEIHQPGAGVPRRMAPLILFGTLVTHLFGGSAGREGTALQMGGGIAATFARVLKTDESGVRLLLMAGVAAGFGSVFGTPIAGAVFALEVLVIGRMQYDALIPCFIASLVAHWTCGAWGIGHTHYQVEVAAAGVRPDFLLFGKVLLAAVVLAPADGVLQVRDPAGRAAACVRRRVGDRPVFPMRHAGLSGTGSYGKQAGCDHAAGHVHLYADSSQRVDVEAGLHRRHAERGLQGR